MGKVRFNEIARECRETFKGSLTDIPIVGLEHIEPYDMKLRNYDVNVETTFTKQFHEGQILFGRRRAYQHKACVATFDGICSGDITVIEPIEGQVYPDLLPFIVQNDDFFEHAIKGSNGALSPRVKWEHMANFELNLPSLAEQKVLAEKLWAAYEVKQSYPKMIAATEEMVKSQFIEMYSSNDFEIIPLDDLCDKISDGSHNPPKGIENSKYLMISSKNVFKDHLDLVDVRYLTKEDFEVENKRTNVKAHDILLTIVGTIGRAYLVRGDEGNLVMQRSVAVLTPNHRVSPLFLMYYLHNDKNLEKEGRGNAQKGIYLKQLSQYKIKVPPIELQINFENIYNQADKSISELRKSVDAIDKVIKSLINENL